MAKPHPDSGPQVTSARSLPDKGIAVRQLPARVWERIARQQEASEELVGWVQLSVVIFFGSLYLFSPKTFSAKVAIEPVPWALAVYMTFTVARLALARRRALPEWLRAISAIVDILLLLLLMWSFHVQYEQPAAFILKSPTLLYVFIFIALRALLFEARYVILTGLAAAFGWLAMVGYVLATDMRDDLITRDYVAYLTSNSLLVGAEFDKIVVILVVTGLLATGIVRARRLLVAAVSEEIRARDLSRFFAPEVADRITAAETEIRPGRGETRDAAILYVDIRSFTTMTADMPADALIAFLTRFQAHLMPPILANHGTAEKYLGDGMMAAFGAAVASDSYAADALRAADGILDEIASWNGERAAAGEPTIRIGVAVVTGKVVFGAVGGEARLEYAVVGYPVNLAAKVEKQNKVEGTRGLCTVDAFDRARAQGHVRDSDPDPERLQGRRVDGLSERLDLVVLAR